MNFTLHGYVRKLKVLSTEIVSTIIVLNKRHMTNFIFLFTVYFVCSTCRKHFRVLFSFISYHRVCNQINTTSATTGAGLAHPSEAHEFTPGFYWGSCYSIFSFICMFFRSLFVLLYFFFWPLCCLFFDIRILIVPLISPTLLQDMLDCAQTISTPFRSNYFTSFQKQHRWTIKLTSVSRQ